MKYKHMIKNNCLLCYIEVNRCKICGNLIKPSNLNNPDLCNGCDVKNAKT